MDFVFFALDIWLPHCNEDACFVQVELAVFSIDVWLVSHKKKVCFVEVKLALSSFFVFGQYKLVATKIYLFAEVELFFLLTFLTLDLQ